MKYKIIFFLSILLLFYSFSVDFNEPQGELLFSNNSPNVMKGSTSSFTLRSDCDMRFKIASKDLAPDTIISLINMDTNEVIFKYQGTDINELLISKVPQGTYEWHIGYTEGFMNFKIILREEI